MMEDVLIIFYDKNKLKPKYIQHIQPPIYDVIRINKSMTPEEIKAKISNKLLWKMNYISINEWFRPSTYIFQSSY